MYREPDALTGPLVNTLLQRARDAGRSGAVAFQQSRCGIGRDIRHSMAEMTPPRRPDEAELTCDMMMPVWIVQRHGLHYSACTAGLGRVRGLAAALTVAPGMQTCMCTGLSGRGVTGHLTWTWACPLRLSE